MSGFSPVEVIKQDTKGTTFNISYVSEVEEIFIFRANIFQNQIQILEFSRNSEVVIEGIPVNLTNLEYLNDKTFLQVDAKLRS